MKAYKQHDVGPTDYVGTNVVVSVHPPCLIMAPFQLYGPVAQYEFASS